MRWTTPGSGCGTTPASVRFALVPTGIESCARALPTMTVLLLLLLCQGAFGAATSLDAMYVEYTDGGRSYYDCEVDPWQTKDLYATLPTAQRAAMASMLAAVKNCTGTACP